MPPILFTFLHLGAVSKVEEMLSGLARPVSITGNAKFETHQTLFAQNIPAFENVAISDSCLQRALSSLRFP